MFYVFLIKISSNEYKYFDFKKVKDSVKSHYPNVCRNSLPDGSRFKVRLI